MRTDKLGHASHLRRKLFHVWLLLAGLALFAPILSAHGAAVDVLFTSDTEGHTQPCQTCPVHVGLGGLARRQTVLKRLRPPADGSFPLLLDAGNALFGPDSFASNGRVIVVVYEALGYDAVNLSYRDFRLGKATTLAAIADNKVAFVSANLLDAQTGKPLAAPYIVRGSGHTKVAVIGLTESPGALSFLPDLRHQLEGVQIRPPAEALAEWLPRARAEARQVILLYYGSAAGLRPLEACFATDLTLILVGGARPDDLPPGSAPPVAAVEEHGKSIGHVRIDGKASIEPPIPVSPADAPDPHIAELIQRLDVRSPSGSDRNR